MLSRAFRNIKNLDFNGLLLTTLYNVWGKEEFRGVMFDGTVKDWQKVWRKSDLCFLNDIKNLANFRLQSKKWQFHF